jgi:hypothetical protein
MKTLRKFLDFAMELLRELSDENAYARYLRATGRTHSAAEWRTFSDHRHRTKYQNAKCC